MASNPRVFKHPIPGTQAASASPKDIRMITPEELCAAVSPKSEVIQVSWAGKLLLTIRSMISMEESIKFIETAMQLCWGGESYYYEVMDFAFRCAVITYYSNVQLPEGLEQKYEIVYGTDLYETILKYTNLDQIDAIREAIKSYINK